MTKAEMTGEYMKQLAERWREANPDAWARMVRIARGYAAEGRRFSMEKLMQAARYDMATNGLSDGFKLNNNARSSLARMLRDEHPHLAEYMDFRKSKVDGL